jgi:hypothetical protein
MQHPTDDGHVLFLSLSVRTAGPPSRGCTGPSTFGFVPSRLISQRQEQIYRGDIHVGYKLEVHHSQRSSFSTHRAQKAGDILRFSTTPAGGAGGTTSLAGSFVV